MVLFLGGVRETPIRRAHGDIAISAPGPPRNVGALHLLDGADTTECPEIRIGNPGKFCYKSSIRYRWSPNFWTDRARTKRDIPLMGSKKSRAALRPALAPWSPSGANRIVAPLEPPVPVSLSYLSRRSVLGYSRFDPGRLTFRCSATQVAVGLGHSFHHHTHPFQPEPLQSHHRLFGNLVSLA